MARYILRHASEALPESSSFLYEPQDQITDTLKSVNEAVANARRDQGYGDAWDGAASRYPSGTVVEGTVSRHQDFGVFVEVEQGFVGLIPKVIFDRPGSKAIPRIQRGSKMQGENPKNRRVRI